MRGTRINSLLTCLAIVGCGQMDQDANAISSDADPTWSSKRPAAAQPLPEEGRAISLPERPSRTTTHHDIAHSDAFYQLLNATSMNEPDLDGSKLIDEAALIVRGRLVSVADGRTIDFASGPSNPIHTLIFQVEVAETMKGSADKYIYVEYIRGGIPVADFDAILPDDEFVLFLRDADTWDRTVHKFVNEGRGRPESTQLYALQTQKGLMLQVAGRVVQPLADGAMDPLGPSVTDLHRVGQAVRDAM
jgi:hypothetical protein